MSRLLKHIGQTLLMILAVSVIAVLPPDKSATIVMPIVWGLIVLILLGSGIYVWKGRKKGLFCVLLFGLMCGLSTTVLAQADQNPNHSEEGSEYDIDALEAKSSTWCSAAESFDDNLENFIKNNEKPLQKEPYKTALKEANRYTYAYDLAVARGQIEETHWYDYIFGRNKYDKALQCAKKLLDVVAEYKTKTNEMAVSTVRRVLEKDEGTCWPCAISILVLNITEQLSLTLEDDLRAAAFDLLGIMLLFWIAYKVITLIGQWGTANISEFFTQLLTRIIVVMIISAILASLNNLNSIYSTFVSPFISSVAGITETIQKGTTTENPEQPNNDTMAVQIGADAALLQCECCANEYKNIPDDDSVSDIPDCNGGNIIGQKVNGEDAYLISRQAKRELMCMTCSIYKQTAPMIAIGRVLTYSSTHLGFWARMGHGAVGAGIGLLLGSPVLGAAVGAALPWPLGMWFVGIGLIVVFTIISVLVAFKLMDIFLKLGFVLFLTPFLVATFAFPSTRTYTKRGWDFFVNAILNILALGIGITFILVSYQATLPEATTGALSALVSEAGDPPNDYAKNLYEALISGQGAFGTFFILMIFLFFGMKILDASQVVIEALSDTSSGIPSIAGAAVTAALRAATAPIRLGLTAAMDHAKTPDIIKDRLKKDEDNSPDDDTPGVFSRTGKWMGDGIGKAGDATKAAGQATEASGKGVEAAGQATAAGGKGARTGGLAMMKGGAGLCSSGFGAIIGIPMLIAGAGLTAVGGAAEVAGHATRYTGKGMQYVGKGVKKAGSAINKVGKPLGKAIKKAGKETQKVVNRIKRLKNRIKQVASNIKRKMTEPFLKIKNASKHLRNKLKKAFRRKAAKNKYGRKRPMSKFTYGVLSGTRDTMDNLLDQADDAVGKADSDAATGGTGGAALENSESWGESQ